MGNVSKKILLFNTMLLFSCLVVFSTANNSEAGGFRTKTLKAYVGPVHSGKQLLTLKVKLTNETGKTIYMVNSFKVEIHGYFHGKDEVYTRNVKVDQKLDNLLYNKQSTTLRVEFYRNANKYRYDEVEIEVLAISYESI